jgi:hypothetical protein
MSPPDRRPTDRPDTPDTPDASTHPVASLTCSLPARTMGGPHSARLPSSSTGAHNPASARWPGGCR